MLKKFSVEKKSGLLNNINLILTIHQDIIKKIELYSHNTSKKRF